MPKKSRRKRVKHPALKAEFNLKTRYELISDYDYLKKLSEEELDWLNKFTEEYVNASIDTKNPKNNLHKTKKQQKDCYDRNNSRNRDVFTRARAMGQSVSLTDLDHNQSGEPDLEDKIIDELDKSKKSTE